MKYKLTNKKVLKVEVKGEGVISVTCYKIKATKNFGNVHAGDFGGWVQNENNLSQEGDCWIYPDSVAIGNSRVEENALIGDELSSAIVKDSAVVRGSSNVVDLSVIRGSSVVYGGKVSNCIVIDSIINGNCWNLIFNGEIISKIDELGDIQLPREIPTDVDSIMKAIDILPDYDKDELFRRLTEKI